MKRFLLLLPLLAGCAVTRPHLVEVTTTTYTRNGVTNVVVRKDMKLPAYVLWPATQSLEKQRGSIGKTLSAGFSGADQDGGSTNVADTIKALDSLLRTASGH